MATLLQVDILGGTGKLQMLLVVLLERPSGRKRSKAHARTLILIVHYYTHSYSLYTTTHTRTHCTLLHTLVLIVDYYTLVLIVHYFTHSYSL